MFFRSSVHIARVARPAVAARGYADKTVAEKVGETVKKVAQSFSADGGAVGSKFRADGEIGQVGEKSTLQGPFWNELGGTFSAKQGGAVGSAFEKDGVVGSTGQKASDKAWDAGKDMKGEPVKGRGA
ncbi:hypothetical protein QFC21_006506 [Naganishia friedmannii]|uniref:Uncharacterized protein n=1 Tax=Naganishia friedmannii TaxID=89922 RepID=A0ACC2V1H9_9TREE|nr:hypothetical protein QFC21_006506 [Naganishia friedmannii]